MDSLDTFAIALAERAFPDDVDSAPLIARLAEQGGEAWKSLTPKQSVVLGGMSDLAIGLPEFATVLSIIWANVSQLSACCAISVVVHKVISSLVAHPPHSVDLSPGTNPDAAIVVAALKLLTDELKQRSVKNPESTAQAVLVSLADQPDGGDDVLKRLAKNH